MENHLASPGATPEVFAHVRIIIGIVLGLCISRLLTGFARFVQHPARQIIYPVHLAWVAFMFLAVVHFWWFEFYLHRIQTWDFETYFYIIIYASLYFLACTLLFPDHMEEYTGYRDYFMSRRKWFFSLLALIFIVDIGDTVLKGWKHYHSFGAEYPLRTAAFVLGSIAAIFTSNQRFHALFVTLMLVYEVAFIMWQYAVLD
ncbi:hypothetical protein C5748_06065 [Phyllobacterium phragmitis]|uniref:Uncharacterized protein n=1 Tax=Phyllobacterium phragmitis TaxID=2670329 RepID=A0A2S9IUI7_9HYPH|nr:hypothetical protein [Phyllobacterium phragmitis]PRD44171.1 hypothetical protein C5748_06065 [Phyllobacterium phragmitis]